MCAKERVAAVNVSFEHWKIYYNVDNIAPAGRHRKIRCVFRPNNPSTCIACFSHGIRCVSQAESEPVPPPHTRMNLSERVAQLEKELASMRANGEVLPKNKGLPADAMQQINGPAHPTVSFRTSSSEISFQISSLPSPAESLPVLSLFDNDIFTSNGRNGLNDSIYREFSTGSLRPAGFESSPHFRKSRIKRAKVCEALTDLLPSHTAMYEILENGGVWWNILRKMLPYMCCEDTKMTIQSYVFLALNQDNPSVIGCALSWMAISLQSLLPDFESNHLGLPLPVSDLTQHYVSSVDRLIVSDDELSISLEGIECILLQAQFYGNVGRPRKGWTTIRRGLSHAVLLGLHRPSLQASSTLSPHAKRRETIWWHLVEWDAYLSLLFSLPSFMVPALLDPEKQNMTSKGPISTGDCKRKLAVLVGTITQRNQAISTSLASLLPATIQIDHELESLVSLLPPLCWDSIMPSGHSRIYDLDTHELMTTHFWHHQAKAYLHLPFLLQYPTDSQFDYNRAQCLIASYEMIQVYIRMRELAGERFNFCRVVDFQGFTAAVILILGLLGHRPTSMPHDTNQEAKHWNLIYKALEVLRKVVLGPENMIAAQCLQSLETLVSIAHGQLSAEENSTGRKIFIPYFGMISVAPVSNYATAETILPQHSTQSTMTSVENTAPPPKSRAQVRNPAIEIDVFNAPFLDNIVQNMDSIPQSTEPNDFSLHDILAMDIDQDWSWMLNADYQMNPRG